MEPWHTETIDTPAGAYTVALYPDDPCPFNPLEDDTEVFAALVEFSGYGGRWDTATDTLGAAGAAGIMVRALVEKFGDDYDAIGRRYLKWQALTRNPWILAMGGRHASQSDYYRYALLANGDLLTDPSAAIKAVMADYQTLAEGSVVGYVTTAPNGETVDSVWGFYDHDEALARGRDAAECDASERLEKTGLAGAGFIGII